MGSGSPGSAARAAVQGGPGFIGKDGKPTTHGFAGMTYEERSAIARRGGQSVQKQGKAPHWTSEEARRYGRKGGLANARNRRAVEG
jgi:general stress protein YciG